MIEFILTVAACAMALFYYWSWYTLKKDFDELAEDYDKLIEDYDDFCAAILMVTKGMATLEARGESVIIKGE